MFGGGPNRLVGGLGPRPLWQLRPCIHAHSSNLPAQRALKQLLDDIGFDSEQTRTQFEDLESLYEINKLPVLRIYIFRPDIDIEILLLDAGIVEPANVTTVRNAAHMLSLLRAKSSKDYSRFENIEKYFEYLYSILAIKSLKIRKSRDKV